MDGENPAAISQPAAGFWFPCSLYGTSLQMKTPLPFLRSRGPAPASSIPGRFTVTLSAHRDSVTFECIFRAALCVSQTHTNFSDRAFSAVGLPVWNYLPTDLRQPDFSYIQPFQTVAVDLFILVTIIIHSLVSGTKAQCECPFNCALEILLLTYLPLLLRNDLYCVGRGVKLYSLTHLFAYNWLSHPASTSSRQTLRRISTWVSEWVCAAWHLNDHLEQRHGWRQLEIICTAVTHAFQLQCKSTPTEQIVFQHVILSFVRYMSLCLRHCCIHCTLCMCCCQRVIRIILLQVDFFSDLGRRITQSTDDHCESAFLFQRLSVFIQRYNAVAVLVPSPTQPPRTKCSRSNISFSF